MPFIPKDTKRKVKASYKTLYLSQELIDTIDGIAEENGTSFNNVVVSMIEYCLQESSDIEGEQPTHD